MQLPYDYCRCVGVTVPTPDGPDRMHQLCNACRRREPGHPDRQLYVDIPLTMAEVPSTCDHRIAPEE